MSGQQRIIVGSAAVSEHVTSISGHSSFFRVTIPSVTGGTAPAITEADELGGDFSNLSSRYADALPTSADKISVIAEVLGHVDNVSSTAIQALGGGSGGGVPLSHNSK